MELIAITSQWRKAAFSRLGRTFWLTGATAMMATTATAHAQPYPQQPAQSYVQTGAQHAAPVYAQPRAKHTAQLPAAASHQELFEVNQLLNRSTAAAPPHIESKSFDPGWWRPMVNKPLRNDTAPAPLSLEHVLLLTLTHSGQVKVFSELPLIRETAIIEASAAFDWHAFVNSRWDDLSEPIGNTLTAGAGATRFQDHNLTGSAGVRRRTLTGGQFEIAQRLGVQNNNSSFFTPNNQGSSRLALSFTQPLMRGRGKCYNTSLQVLAQIDQHVAEDEFRRQLESHLLETARAYWALYLERAVLYQKINSYVRGKQVFDRLQQRRGIDAPANQIISTQATIQQRQSELLRAQAAVKNAESRLRSLVNDPRLENLELIPVDAPSFEIQPVDQRESVTVALQQRPEMAQAIKRIKAASVRLNMSKHELMPVLNLVLEGYLSGLAAEGEALRAARRQLDTGSPSYSVGLEFEMPFQNRAANARLQRRKIELRQIESQYRTTLQNIRMEVEVAVREIQTSSQELSTKHAAMQARLTHLNALTARWNLLPGENITSSLALENLLVAQEHLARAEFEYLQAQLTSNLAAINLKKVTGTLLQHEQVSRGRGCLCGAPVQILDKPLLPPTQQAPQPARSAQPHNAPHRAQPHSAQWQQQPRHGGARLAPRGTQQHNSQPNRPAPVVIFPITY